MSRAHPRKILPGANRFVGEVAERGERHVIRAIPRFGNGSESLSLTIALEAEPSALELRNSRETRCGRRASISNCSAWWLGSAATTSVGNHATLYFSALRELRIRLPNFPAPTEIILENSDSHARLSGRNSCQNPRD